MTAAELARGRALREAERDELWQSRTTHALSEWLDRHCDDLLEAAEALAEKDAQIAALQAERAEWREVSHALKVVERLREIPAPPAEPQDPRYKHILSGDYYMPGHKHETKERETHMTDPIIDVQTTLDDWLKSNPEAQKYVRKIYYVPDGAQIPRDVTHMNRLTSIDYPDLELRLGVVATLETAALANLILGLIERTADDPKA